MSVEIAIKMCLQYWRARGRPAKSRLLTVRGGYHGDTFGAMAVCDPETGMHHLFADVLARHVFAERPPAGYDAPLDPAYVASLEQLVAEHADRLAAVVVEPVVQGAGGMRFYAPGYLNGAARALRPARDPAPRRRDRDRVSAGPARCSDAGTRR